MTAKWELMQKQGSREIWKVKNHAPDQLETAQYKGEEFTEVSGERTKVEEIEYFDTETEAIAWLNAGVG
ncbi:hypothetical protein ATO6_15265 [Oceanicola sp. 22II-s10i]|uniref:hypothetical protein n=1 Tax=Oceanicola sp. 22II-s10i TaxID=1317116 RepID=UPI000B528B4D|nr:hypothetical protein [Oceanicola sp. 22II-s10i]OWU83793.1 hypothetical protein ATO6_15265 [Oceanicola sp. 22II-s10i]